ncbi:MAG: sulfatase-like hydrolase/transferase [Saprospiraceae bacterium]|nr:sulfatase-like hydrolase/transferase [Saprospiraceae bacterium]
MHRKATFYIVLLSFFFLHCTEQSENLDLPNIILVMADDQGWGDMGYNGHPIVQTPNFDLMASTSLRFDRFYAAAPVCTPTRASVMTGRHPNRMGAFNWGHTLRPKEITLAEALKTQGYRTGHFGKWHLGSVRQGSEVNPGASGFDSWFSAPNFFDNDPILSREGKAVKTIGESSMVTVDAALDFIEDHHGQHPYLAVVWFGSPHLPHEAHAIDQQSYQNQNSTRMHFYGELTGMDRAFGKLRNQVRSLPGNEQTIIWYCSDNGGLPHVGATGGRGHKGQVYEGGLRVPAILEWPSVIRTPRYTDVPCVTSDIMPTLLDIIGTPAPNVPIDGISLLPLIKGTMTVRKESIGFWNYPRPGVRTPSKSWMEELFAAQQTGNMVGDSSRLRPEASDIVHTIDLDSLLGHSAWLKWPYKLHRIARRDTLPYFELYNLEKDPGEKNNLLPMETKAPAMQQSLLSWQQSVVNSYQGADY